MEEARVAVQRLLQLVLDRGEEGEDAVEVAHRAVVVAVDEEADEVDEGGEEDKRRVGERLRQQHRRSAERLIST